MGSHVVEAHDINIRVSIRVGGLSGLHLVFVFGYVLSLKFEVPWAIGVWPEVVSSSCSPWGGSLNEVQVMESQAKMIL